MALTRAEIPSLESLRDKCLQDIKRCKIRAGVTRPNVSPGSESYIKSEAWASGTLELHAKVAALQDATMPDSAEGEDLERLALVWKGLSKSAGAGASGYAKVSVSGTVIFIADQECTTEDGLRYKVTTTTLATNNGLVPIVGIDVGKATDKAAGAKLTWSSPPSGSSTSAVVGSGGLTGGQDPDDDSGLRERFLYALKHHAGAGNWADVSRWAVEASPSIEMAFVYPGIEGPSTVHVAIVVEATEDNYYSRVASATLVNLAVANIVAENPEHSNVTTTACVDEAVDMVLKLTLPAHEIDGGSGGGWLDPVATRWPSVGGATPFATRLSAAPSSGTLINVTTYTAPVDGAYIAIWSSSHKQFVHTRVKSSTFVSGSVYAITLYTAIDTTKIASGDYISSDAENIDAYGTTLLSAFVELGPGEKTASATLLPRSYRHPLNLEEWGYQFTSKHVGVLSQHDEIDHVSVIAPTSLPISPTTATLVTDAPNILVLSKLALYQV